MLKFVGPLLLLLVVGFGVASFFIRSLVTVFSILLIAVVFIGIVWTFMADVKASKQNGGS